LSSTTTPNRYGRDITGIEGLPLLKHEVGKMKTRKDEETQKVFERKEGGVEKRCGRGQELFPFISI
jgi:hypothetical protein